MIEKVGCVHRITYTTVYPYSQVERRLPIISKLTR